MTGIKKNNIFKLLFLLTLLLSCSPSLYKSGDRLFKKGNYEAAIIYYNQSLSRDNLEEKEIETLKYKIARAFYFNGNKPEAMETLRNTQNSPSELVCPILDLKMKILSEMKVYLKNSESIDLLEGFEMNNCPESANLVAFYDGFKKFYYPNTTRTGEIHLIKGNLKRDSGDAFAALEYYKKALRDNPDDGEILLATIDAFKTVNSQIEKEFTKREIAGYYKHDMPLFFSLLSELYSKEDMRTELKARLKEHIASLAVNFVSVKVVKPLPVHSNLYLQTLKNLVKTFDVNSVVKVLKIDQGEERNNYIVYSYEGIFFSLTEKIDGSYFIPN